MNADFRRVKEIFLAAVENQDTAERDAYVHEACGENEDLRRQVDALLGKHAQAGSFLEAPAPGPVVTVDELPVLEQPGSVIGPYKLLELIGEGGMGAVWMAEQREPVRKVALKIIKAGMDTRQVVARFEAERQALALMDHPNIAKVFDGGTTAGGRPYFVMELVKGVPITRYCDEHRLTPRERLELFLPVCQAIQHAHQKGIIHRDIKPANVLVAPYDGRPVPKVIDFGVAKATGQRLTERTLFTGFGAVVGTLEYMSPEQAELNNQDIDTRSDIYSLGVLLYELLTGTTPLSHQRLKQAAFTEVLRLIREEEPPRPSTRLSESKDTLPSISAQRHMEPAKLTKLVRGELDWIVMKTLEKDRNRRYETANGFALDVQRYLADEPVQACPPSLSYRLWKFVRRHRGPVLAAATILLLLFAGIVGTTWGLVREADQRQVAQANEQRALAARKTAYDEKNTAEAARKTAQDEKQAAVREKKRAEEQLRRTELALYAGQLAQAQREWQDGNTLAALDILNGTQWDLRDWEFRHLWTRYNSKLTLRGHMLGVNCVAFSPDGKRLVSGSDDKTLKVWDAATGHEVFSLRGHTGGVLCVAFSPDGKRLVSGNRDLRKPELKVWDAATGQELLSLKGHTWPVYCVAFSPDGKRIVSGGNHFDSVKPGELKVWDAASGQELLSLKGHTARISCVAYSPDGKRLLSGSYDRTLKVWEADTGQVVLSLKGHTGPVTCVAFRPDGKRLASGSWDRTLKVWEAEKGQEVLALTGHTGRVACVAFSPDGKRLVSGSWDDHTLKVWDADTGQGVQTHKGHTGGVSCVAFSPDGKRFVSGSTDQTLKVWDAERSQEVLALQGHTGALSCVAFSPDRKRLATGNSGLWIPQKRQYGSGELKVWDAATDQELFSLKGHAGGVHCVAFSPDGKRLVSGGGDPGDPRKPGELKVWDASKGQELLSLKGHTGPVGCVAFSPDGKRLASGSGHPITPLGPAELKVWDAATGQELLCLKGHTGGVYCVAFSPDGKRLVSGGGGSLTPGELKVWDAATGQELLSLKGHPTEVLCVAFSPDGKRLVSGTGGRGTQGGPIPGELKVWDAATGQELLSLKGHRGSVSCVAFGPDGKRLVSGGGELNVWDTDIGQVLLSLKGHTGGVNCVAFSPDGKRLVSGGGILGQLGELKVWDADQRQALLALKGHNWAVTCVAFSPDGKRIVSSSDDRTLKVWDAIKGRELLVLKGHTGQVRCVAFSPDGKRLVSGGLGLDAQRQPLGGEVKVWDAATGQELLALIKEHTGQVLCVAFSPDGKRIASGSDDNNTVKVWDAVTGQEVLALKGHTGRVHCVAFSPDGKRLVSGSWDQTLKVWDAATGQELLCFKGHAGPVYCMAFSPDGKRLVSGGGNGGQPGELKVWDAATGQELFFPKGHTPPVLCVAFSPDGKRIASGSADFTLKVWDADNGTELFAFQGHTNGVSSVAFSPDGKRIASGSADFTVKVWDTDTVSIVVNQQGGR